MKYTVEEIIGLTKKSQIDRINTFIKDPEEKRRAIEMANNNELIGCHTVSELWGRVKEKNKVEKTKRVLIDRETGAIIELRPSHKLVELEIKSRTPVNTNKQ